MPSIAVITCDVIESSALAGDEFEKVMQTLQKESDGLQDNGFTSYFETFRGDSLQMIIDAPEKALQAALILKTAVNICLGADTSKRGNKIRTDIRFAIGMGESRREHHQKMTNEAPFVRSGQKLDEIAKEDLKMAIKSGIEILDDEINTELYLYEGIMQRWTIPVAEVVYHKLKGNTEQAIADVLKISQSAVNQRSHSAYWSGLSLLLKQYQKRITEQYHG